MRVIPCLDHILIDGYSGVDIRDHYLVTDFDVAQMRNEVHPRVVTFKRRSGAWVTGRRSEKSNVLWARSVTYAQTREAERRERSRR